MDTLSFRDYAFDGRMKGDVDIFSLSSSRPAGRRVALLGIAQRQIRLKYTQKSRKQQRAKPLPASIKTVGDWIQVKRIGKNLTPGHLALKMGIATALVLSWEDGSIQPDNQQLEALVKVLGVDLRGAAVDSSAVFGALDNYTADDSRWFIE